MSHISGKRAATSPLDSEFNKRPKLGLSDKELKALNEALEDVSSIPISGPDAVESKYLARAFREVALQTSNIDETWRDFSVCKEFACRLSSRERHYVVSLWLEAREKDWEKFANHCA